MSTEINSVFDGIFKMLLCFVALNGVIMFIWWCSGFPITRDSRMAGIQTAIILVTIFIAWFFDFFDGKD